MARNAELVDKSYFYWRGALSILVGIFVLVWPGLTVLTLVTMLSIWLLILGVISIVEGIGSINKGGMGWLVSLLVGLLQLGVGAYLVQRPGVTTLTILALIGAVFVVQGVGFLLKTFMEAGASGGQRLLSLVFAVLSFVAGVWIWRYPVGGALSFVWLLGLYMVASGSVLIAMGMGSKE